MSLVLLLLQLLTLQLLLQFFRDVANLRVRLPHDMLHELTANNQQKPS